MSMTPANALAFFASVIKSGEPWTPSCQQAYDEAMSHLAQPAQSVDVAGAIRKGFMTAESCGPDNRYVLSIKFGSLDDLQAAHNALVGLTAALQEKGNG